MKILSGNRDVDMKILNYLEDKDLKNICYSNKYFYELSRKDYFWANRIIEKFFYIELDVLKKYKKNKKWKQYYWELVSVNKKLPNDLLKSATKRIRFDYIMIAVHNGAIIPCHNYEKTERLVKDAVKCGKLNILKFLMERGALVREDDLTTATSRGDLEIVKYILEHTQKIKTDCAYDLAEKYNHQNVMNWLVRNGY